MAVPAPRVVTTPPPPHPPPASAAGPVYYPYAAPQPSPFQHPHYHGVPYYVAYGYVPPQHQIPTVHSVLNSPTPRGIRPCFGNLLAVGNADRGDSFRLVLLTLVRGPHRTLPPIIVNYPSPTPPGYDRRLLPWLVASNTTDHCTAADIAAVPTRFSHVRCFREGATWWGRGRVFHSNGTHFYASFDQPLARDNKPTNPVACNRCHMIFS